MQIEFAAASVTGLEEQVQVELAVEAKAKKAAYQKAAYDKRKLAKLAATSATARRSRSVNYYNRRKKSQVFF